MNRRLNVLALSATVGLLAPAVGVAQSAQPSFGDLASRVAVGARVRVEDSSGARLTGRLTLLTPGEIAIEVSGARRQFGVDSVREIALVRRYRLVGALLGAGLWTAQEAWTSCRSDSKGVCDLDMPIIFGAGLGAIIGGFVHTTKVVYPEPRMQVKVAPVVSRGTVGIRARMRW